MIVPTKKNTIPNLYSLLQNHILWVFHFIILLFFLIECKFRVLQLSEWHELTQYSCFNSLDLSEVFTIHHGCGYA